MESERLEYRLLRKVDFPLYYALTGNSRVMHFISGRGLTREEAQKRFLEGIDEKGESGTGLFGVRLKSNGEFIGIARFTISDEVTVEIGYSLLPSYWNKGYGTEMSRALIEFAAEYPGLEKLIAIIDPENTASRKILEKHRFKKSFTGEIDGLPGEIYTLWLP